MAVRFNDILQAIDSAIADFNSTIPKVQRDMLASVEESLRKLDITSSGNIKTSVSNLKVIADVKNKLQKIIVTDDYLKMVNEFVGTYTTITDLQNQYWQAIESKFKPGSLLKEIKVQAVRDTVNSLTEQGIGNQISGDISDILKANITTGGSYRKLSDQLRVALTDQEGNPGLLTRYADQITIDAISQYAAQYTQVISDDLGFEWFAYTGSDILTTRPFCDAMTDFVYFHVSEIPRLLKAEGLYYTNKKTGKRELVPINKKTGLPGGMIEGTNPDNFRIRRGGYRCGHEILPVFEKQVPKAIIARVAAKGKIPFNKPPEKVEDKKTAFENNTTDFSKALEFYTGANFQTVNNLLRGKDKNINPDYMNFVDSLSKGLKIMPKYEGTVYRGISFADQNEYKAFVKNVKNSSGLFDKGFTSTTKDPAIADYFANRQGSFYKVKMEIQSKNGVDISDLVKTDEQEILFDHGAAYDIIGMAEIGQEDIWKMLTLKLKER